MWQRLEISISQKGFYDYLLKNGCSYVVAACNLEITLKYVSTTVNIQGVLRNLSVERRHEGPLRKYEVMFV